MKTITKAIAIIAISLFVISIAPLHSEAKQKPQSTYSTAKKLLKDGAKTMATETGRADSYYSRILKTKYLGNNKFEVTCNKKIAKYGCKKLDLQVAKTPKNTKRIAWIPSAVCKKKPKGYYCKDKDKYEFDENGKVIITIPNNKYFDKLNKKLVKELHATGIDHTFVVFGDTDKVKGEIGFSYFAYSQKAKTK